MQLLIIPKKLTRGGDLIVVPKDYFEKLDSIKNRLLGEEMETDEAIRIFDSERRAGKLRKARGFADILGVRTFQ